MAPARNKVHVYIHDGKNYKIRKLEPNERGFTKEKPWKMYGSGVKKTSYHSQKRVAYQHMKRIWILGDEQANV